MFRGRSINPFYVLLVLAGAVFCVTACGYGVMAVRQLHAVPPDVAAVPSGEGFLEWMDQHGPTAMLVELIILGVATVAAIGTDHYWTGSKD